MARPTNIIPLTAVLLAIILLNPIANAETYKWKDAKGKIHYTDSLPTDQIEHEQMDLGECKTDKCRNDLQQDQIEAAKRLQETEKWNSEQGAERKKQDAQQQPESARKQPPRNLGY